jgi:sugar/nucleoside kinase (ribokinase family)
MNMNNTITIHGTGCGLVDFLYPKIDFSAPAFMSKLSQKDGDGGLGIGKLVFAEDFEVFSGMPYEKFLAEIADGAPSHNLGGPAVVSIVHAAQVLGERAQISFYGVRGNDKTGDLVEEALARIGFAPKGGNQSGSASYILKRFTGPSPRTDVLSDPAYDNGHGERTFINLIGDAGQLAPSDLGDDFFNADIITFGGTALTPLIHDNLTELLSRAKQKNACTIVNLVYDYRSSQKAPGKKWNLGKKDDAYPYIDLLVADKDEAVKTSGCSSIGKALQWFLDRGCGGVVITEGARPVHLGAGQGIFSPLTPQTIPVCEGINRELAAHPENRGDTTGCGDNFAGGIIAGLAEQLGTVKRNAEGTKKLSAEGAQFNLREICIPGIVAGGYACFTLGGVFYETRPGEKQTLLAPFIEEYKAQLKTEGIIS